MVGFTTITSKSEMKEKDYSGVVISKSAPNSIRATCKVNYNVEGSNVVHGLPLYSPMVQNFDVVKYGSNHLRKKLHYIPKLDMPHGRLQEPVIRGAGYKKRTGSVKQ